jgi:hypothetical protein
MSTSYNSSPPFRLYDGSRTALIFTQNNLPLCKKFQEPWAMLALSLSQL